MIAIESKSAPGRVHTYSLNNLWLVGFCFVLSGASGLIYEVLWARMLGLVFGATTFAVSAVLAAFMGGLALGSAVAGRLSARLRRPLRAYGLIEICIALYALAVPFMFRLIDAAYAFVWQQMHPGFYAFSFWRFVLASAALLVPTTLMGATLPVLASALLRSARHTPTSVTRLYTYNLLGAICGTLLAGFILLPNIGVSATIWTAASINFIVGLIALLADRTDAAEPHKHPENLLDQQDERAQESEIAREALNEDEELRARTPVLKGETETLKGEPQTAIWLCCAAVSGFVTFSAQVAWTRVLTMIIGSSTYAFSIVVALFLLGLAGGAYVVGHQKVPRTLLRTVMKVELATAASLIFSLWLTNRAPAFLLNTGVNYGINSWTGWLSLQALVAAMLVLVPAFLMGMVMPLVLVWASHASASASVKLVGRSYAINTVGAIVGAFMTGFILIPKGSVRFSILFSASLCIIVAGLAYRSSWTRLDQDLARALTAGATLALIIVIFLFAPRMNSFDLSSGAYDSLISMLARPQLNEAPGEQRTFGPETNRLLMFEEGPTATVSVREDWGTRSLAINGRVNASDRGDMPTQVMLGQLPVLLAPHADEGLIIGFASGVSVGAMLQSPVKSIECVELEPATVNAAAFFNHVNHRPLEDARLRLIIDDARAYLRVSPKLYDMIVSEPSHPWVPGVANLFTREFFTLGSRRLRDDGVFVQWLQTYQLSTESLRSVLATYHSVFPHVQVFRVGGAAKGKDLILVGSRQPLTLDRLSERMSDPRVQAELARINLTGPDELLSWYVCDERQLGPAVAGAAINTDDNMRIENRAPREAFIPLMETNAAWIETLATEARNAH